MPLQVVKGDITARRVDAIVNSTNRYMLGFSGVDKRLHELGGPEFEAECAALRGKCVPGESVYTKAYNLDCRYIIHTISLNWEGGIKGEAAILRSCYRSALELARDLGCRSVAFPLISAGNRSFPLAEALKLAATSINEHLTLNGPMDVYLVLFNSVVQRIAETELKELQEKPAAPVSRAALEKNLQQILSTPGESFVDMLFRLMDRQGIDKASDLYKTAGVTKATFSKLISGGSKRPSLQTAVGLAFALKLSYEEAVKFLAAAGLALSEGSDFDRTVTCFLKAGCHDIWELDIQLMARGYTPLLGDD